jgi:hypothetical protein
MHTTSIRIAGIATLTAAAYAFAPMPSQAQMECNLADQDDIPIFVLDRIELLSGTAQVD